MSDPNPMDQPDRTGIGSDPGVEKTPREGPDINEMEADNPVEEETIETVDPENPPA